MKKTDLINSELSYVVATLGHKDTLVVCDAGLPIPPQTERIDLALTRGIPSFLDTLRVVLKEMQVERVIVAGEMEQVSPDLFAAVRALLPDTPVDLVPHTRFKEMTADARAVVRTGEFTPYANVILVSGVVF